MPVNRGEIYWVEFDPVKGSEQGGLRASFDRPERYRQPLQCHTGHSRVIHAHPATAALPVRSGHRAV